MKRSITISQKNITVQAYIWLALPTLIWIIGWLRPLISIPLTLAFTAVLFLIFRKSRGSRFFNPDGFSDVAVNRKYAVIILLLFLFTCFTGVGAVYYQDSGDAMYRNAIFYDLSRNPWPVTYGDNPEDFSVLCYFFGFWLPPALVSKITGFILPGDIAQLLYAFWGMTIIFNFLFSRFGGHARYMILAVFLLYCGWDTAIYMIFDRVPSGILQLIFDQKDISSYYYASNATYSLFVHNYNQAYTSFIALLLLYHSRNNSGSLIFTYSLMFISAPFAAAGLLPLFAFHVLKNIRNYLTWQNAVGIIVFLTESAFLITNNNGANPVKGAGMDRIDIVTSGIVFVIFSYCIYLPWIWKSVRHDSTFYILGATMLIGPYLSLGGAPDMGWRMGIPFAVYYMMKVMRYVLNIKKWKTPSHIALATLLLIGAIAPVTHHTRAVITPVLHFSGNDRIIAEAYEIVPSTKYFFSWKSNGMITQLHSPDNYHYNNFFADGESFFTRYLMRRP